MHQSQILDKCIIEFLPDKYPVGKYFAEDFNSFSSIEVAYSPNDLLYMFSDGFADQFGGENNRKFMYNKFRNLIVEASESPLYQQISIIEHAFNQWKGKYDQIDDVLVLGLKLDI